MEDKGKNQAEKQKQFNCLSLSLLSIHFCDSIKGKKAKRKQ